MDTIYLPPASLAHTFVATLTLDGDALDAETAYDEYEASIHARDDARRKLASVTGTASGSTVTFEFTAEEADVGRVPGRRLSLAARSGAVRTAVVTFALEAGTDSATASATEDASALDWALSTTEAPSGTAGVGPRGTAGTDGADGADGAPGQDGADGGAIAGLLDPAAPPADPADYEQRVHATDRRMVYRDPGPPPVWRYGSDGAAVDVTAPALPTALALAWDGSEITATWADPADADLASVEVYRGTEAGALTLLATVDAGTESHASAVDADGTTYYYALRAVDVAALRSALTAEASVEAEEPAGYELSGASAMAGPFTSVNYLATAAGAGGPDLTPGNSLALLFWLDALPSSDASPWGYGDGSTGWWFDVNSGGTLYLLRRPSGGVYTLGPVRLGLNAVAVTVTDGGALRASLNGFTAVQLHAAPAFVAASASATEAIGRAPSGIGAYPLTSGRVLEAAHVAAAAADADLVAWSAAVRALDRYRLPDSLRDHAALASDLAVSRDWDGAAASATAGAGSAPRTYAVNGTVGRAAIEAERVYAADPSWWADSGYSEARTAADGAAYVRRSPFARVRVQTAATRLVVDLRADVTGGQPAWLGAGLDDGATVRGVPLLRFSYASARDLTLPSGSKAVEVWDGLQTLEGSVPRGSFVSALRVPDSTPLSVLAPAATDRLIVYGDSIAVGDRATNAATEAWTMVLRRARAASDPAVSTMVEAWGSRSLDRDGLNDAARQAFAERLAGYLAESSGQTAVWLAIGTNDYGLNRWSAAAFGAAYADLLDRIHAEAPSAAIYAQTPIVRASEGANGSGSTLADYRAEIASAAGARPWATLVDGTAILTTGDLSDGVHPTTAGHAAYAAAVAAVLQ